MANPITAEDVAAWRGVAPPPPKKGNAFVDLPLMATAGAVDLVGGAASLATRGVAAVTGSETLSNVADSINRGRAEVSDNIRGATSPLQQEANQQTLGEAWDSGNVIRKVAGVAAESLPTMLPAAALAKGALAAGKAAGLVKNGFDGLGKLGQFAVTGPAEAAVTAITAPEDARLRVENTPTEQLMQTPAFQKALAENGGDVAKTRKQMEGDAAVSSLSQSVGTLLGSAIAGSGVLGKLISAETRGATRIANIASGFRNEMAQEFIQSGAERIAQNDTTQRFIDPATNLLDGAFEDALLGGLAGGLTGGVAGAIMSPNRPPTPPAPAASPALPTSAAVPPAGTPPAGVAPPAGPAPSADFPNFKSVYAKTIGAPDTDEVLGEANVAFSHVQDGASAVRHAAPAAAPVAASETAKGIGGNTRITRAAATPELTAASGGLTDHVLELKADDAQRAKLVTVANKLVKGSTVPVEMTNAPGRPVRIGFKTVEDAHAFYAALTKAGASPTGAELSTGTGAAAPDLAKRLGLAAMVDPADPSAGWRMPVADATTVGGKPVETVVIPDHRYQALRRSVGLPAAQHQEARTKWDALEADRQSKIVTDERLNAALDMTAPTGKAPAISKGLRAAVTDILSKAASPMAADVDRYLKDTKLDDKTVAGLKLWAARLANGGKDVEEQTAGNEKAGAGQTAVPAEARGKDGNEEAGAGQTAVPAEVKAEVKAEVRAEVKAEVEAPPAAKPVETPTAPKATKEAKAKAARKKAAPKAEVPAAPKAEAVPKVETPPVAKPVEPAAAAPKATKEAKAKAARKKAAPKAEVPAAPKAEAKKSERAETLKAIKSAFAFVMNEKTAPAEKVGGLAWIIEEASHGEASVEAKAAHEKVKDHPLYGEAKALFAKRVVAEQRRLAKDKLKTAQTQQVDDENANEALEAARELRKHRRDAMDAQDFAPLEDDAGGEFSDPTAPLDDQLYERPLIRNGIGVPASPKLAELLRAGDVSGSLLEIMENSKSALYRRLARQILRLLPKNHGIQLRVAAVGDMAPVGLASARGMLNIDTGNQALTVWLKDVGTGYGNGLKETTFLHEMLHAVVAARYYILSSYIAPSNTLGGKKADAVIEELWEMYREVKYRARPTLDRSDAPFWLVNALENVDEFFAWSQTSPEFQDWLREQKVERTVTVLEERSEAASETVREAPQPKSLWDRMVDWMHRLFGFTSADVPEFAKTAMSEAQLTTRTEATALLDDVLRLGERVLIEMEQDAGDRAILAKIAARAMGKEAPSTVLHDAATAATAAVKMWNTQGNSALRTLVGSAFRTALGWSSMKNLAWVFGDEFTQMRAFTELKNAAAGFANGLKRDADHIRAKYEVWARKYGKQLSSVQEGGRALTMLELFNSTINDITSLHINPRVAFDKQPRYSAKNVAGNTAMRKDYDAVMAKWQALASNGGQRILRDKLEFTEALAEQEYEAAVRNIVDLFGATSQVGLGPQSSLKDIEAALDAGRLGVEATQLYKPLARGRAAMDGTYFHIGRYGDFFLRYVDEAGERVYQRFETEGELAEAVADVKSRKDAKGVPLHEGVNKSGEPTFYQGRIAEALEREFSGTFEVIKKLYERIDARSDLSEAQKAGLKLSLRDMYISMLPEMSAKRVMVARKNVKGYSVEDLPRSWAKRSVIAINRLSRLKYSPMLGEAMRDMASQVVELERGTDVRAAVRARDIFNEVKRRDAEEYDTNELPWVSSANALSHNFYLGMSPSYLLMNLLQPIQLTLPALGSRHGFVKSMAAMKNGAKKAFAIMQAMHLENGLRPYVEIVTEGPGANYAKLGLTLGEAQAVRRAFDTARIDGTYYSHINAVSDGQTGKLHRASMIVGVGAHYGEIFNRLVTTLAAYNLEIARQSTPKERARIGVAQENAEVYALETVDQTQFDYSTANKARQLGTHGFLGPVTPLVAQFASYSTQMLEMLVRTGHNMRVVPPRDPIETDAEYAARTKEVQREARRQFAGLMTTTGLLAGTMGLPFATIIARAIEALAGDDDEPYDAKVAYQTWLASVFGDRVGEVLAKGVPRAAGVDLSRSGLQDLLPFSQFLADRRRWEDRVAALAVDSAGPAFGLLGIMARTIDAADSGLPASKVVEIAAPNAVKGLVKSYEAWSAGGFATDTKGTKIPLQLDTWDMAQMALGMTPADLKSQREKQYAQNTKEQLLGRRQMALRTEMRQAIRANDAGAKATAQEAIDTFNEANPAYRITLSSVYQGLNRSDREFKAGLTGPGNLPAMPKDIARGKIGPYDYR